MKEVQRGGFNYYCDRCGKFLFYTRKHWWKDTIKTPVHTYKIGDKSIHLCFDCHYSYESSPKRREDWVNP